MLSGSAEHVSQHDYGQRLASSGEVRPACVCCVQLREDS